jgi:hypothetical protein
LGDAARLSAAATPDAAVETAKREGKLVLHTVVQHKGFDQNRELMIETERMVTVYRFPKEHWHHLKPLTWWNHRLRRCGCVPMQPTYKKVPNAEHELGC